MKYYRIKYQKNNTCFFAKVTASNELEAKKQFYKNNKIRYILTISEVI